MCTVVVLVLLFVCDASVSIYLSGKVTSRCQLSFFSSRKDQVPHMEGGQSALCMEASLLEYVPKAQEKLLPCK